MSIFIKSFSKFIRSIITTLFIWITLHNNYYICTIKLIDIVNLLKNK